MEEQRRVNLRKCSGQSAVVCKHETVINDKLLLDILGSLRLKGEFDISSYYQ